MVEARLSVLAQLLPVPHSLPSLTSLLLTRFPLCPFLSPCRPLPLTLPLLLPNSTAQLVEERNAALRAELAAVRELPAAAAAAAGVEVSRESPGLAGLYEELLRRHGGPRCVHAVRTRDRLDTARVGSAAPCMWRTVMTRHTRETRHAVH